MKKLLALSVLISVGAQAQTYDYSKKWGIGGSFGYNTPIFGNPFNNAADGDETWGLHVRYHLNQKSGLEAAFTRHEFSDVRSAVQVTDVTWFNRVNPTSRFTPVWGLGAGVVDITKTDPKNLKLGLKARAGAEYALTEAFSLGLNVDYQHVNKMFFADNLPSRNIHILAARVGLTWYFGGAAKAAAAATTAAVAKVIDLDSDKDGVSDKKDKCPGTPAGVKVNAYGCALEEKATVNIDVKFNSGKAELDHAYDSDLKEMAAFMAEHPKTKIEIQGHTDSSGSKALNKRLSQQRADSVKNYLVKELKVDASRLTAKGHGDEMPVGDNKTQEGRTKNRRVVAVITE